MIECLEKTNVNFHWKQSTFPSFCSLITAVFGSQIKKMVQEEVSNNRLLKLIFPLPITSKKDFSDALFQAHSCDPEQSW